MSLLQNRRATESPGKTLRSNSGRKFIIACGGDGTINEVANGILQTGEDIEFGVLPSGTGGDFRRTIGMPANVARSRESLARRQNEID